MFWVNFDRSHFAFPLVVFIRHCLLKDSDEYTWSSSKIDPTLIDLREIGWALRQRERIG